MFQWQKGLLELDDHVITQLSDFWSEHVPGYSLNENGIKGLKRLQKKFSIDEIMVAIKIATEQYLEYEDRNPSKESVEQAWKKVGGICRMNSIEKDNPNLKRLYYIRGILRNRLSYCNETLALKLLQQALEANASLDSLETHAKLARNWSSWRSGIEEFLDNQDEDYDE